MPKDDKTMSVFQIATLVTLIAAIITMIVMCAMPLEHAVLHYRTFQIAAAVATVTACIIFGVKNALGFICEFLLSHDSHIPGSRR